MKLTSEMGYKESVRDRDLRSSTIISFGLRPAGIVMWKSQVIRCKQCGKYEENNK